MSDEPLFKNADAQEAAYAPEQLADTTEGDRRANLEEGGGATGGVTGPPPGTNTATTNPGGFNTSGGVAEGATYGGTLAPDAGTARSGGNRDRDAGGDGPTGQTPSG